MNNINENINEKREEISGFLERLINQYKNQELPEEQERRITEFYIKECYLSYLNSSNDSVSSNESVSSNDDNAFKYLTMGWYIYEQLIKKK